MVVPRTVACVADPVGVEPGQPLIVVGDAVPSAGANVGNEDDHHTQLHQGKDVTQRAVEVEEPSC